MGLLSSHPDTPSFLCLQPIFTYFLCNRLSGPEGAEVKQAVEVAFRQLYDELTHEMAEMLLSNEVKKKQLGQTVMTLEYENLTAALNLALKAQVSILNPYKALSLYLDSTRDGQRGLELGETILARLAGYSDDKLAGPLGAEFVSVIDNIGKRQLALKQYPAAEASYRKVLTIWLKNKSDHADEIRHMSAAIYHQLGMVAEEQRQWEQAEDYYRKALKIYIEFSDEHADIYHQLGIVAEEQRQWEQAEDYYQQALKIYIESDDRYEQADIYYQLGIVVQKQGRWEQAEDYYQQALQLKIEFNDRYSQASTYHQLGMVVQKQRRWEQAGDYYQKALQLKIEFNDRYSQASTYHQLGRVAVGRGQWEQARHYFLQDLAISVEFNDARGLGITLRSFARLWRASGDINLPAAIAPILGVSPGEAESLLHAKLPDK